LFFFFVRNCFCDHNLTVTTSQFVVVVGGGGSGIGVRVFLSRVVDLSSFLETVIKCKTAE
jgi:hypothetical protein